MSESLTGVWDGLFSYPRLLKPTPFTAVILDIGGALSGTIHETPEDGPAAGQTRGATLEGECSGRAVSFTKTYDPVGDRPAREVNYRGTLDAEGDEIEGTWTIPGNWSGKFMMIRPRSVGEAAEAEAREPVDAG